jgi:hypothetical protein
MVPRQHPFETDIIANMSPASAASTAPRLNPRASPSSKVAAAGWDSRVRPGPGNRGTISAARRFSHKQLQIAQRESASCICRESAGGFIP